MRACVPLVPPRAVFTCAALVALALPACDSGGDDGPKTAVTVMTRNLFLGGDFTDLVGPSLNTSEIPARAGTLWTTILATDYPSRAKLVADEIVAAAPHLVGLQEVELFRVQTPGDFSFAAPDKNATTVALDFLAILLAELEARGARYRAVSVNQLSDVELPALLPAGERIDVRLTDRDVVLAREDVVTGEVDARSFVTHLAIPLDALLIEVFRGRQVVKASVGGASFTFVNSHLEVGGGLVAFRDSQALELANLIGTLGGPVIAVGDFNSSAITGHVDAKAYGELTRVLEDSWPDLHPGDPGFTCCTPLAAPAFMGQQRIDLALTRGNVRADQLQVVGTTLRTSGGLFASDHAGVVGVFGVPSGQP